MCHEVGQRTILHKFTDLRALASIPRRLIRLAGPIAARAIIASDLATDSRWRPVQCRRNHPNRLACHNAASDLFSLDHGQCPSRSAPLGWAYPARLRHNALDR